MELENRLAEWVMNTTFQDLPEKPITVEKYAVLDTLGSIAAGAYSEENVSLIGLLSEFGGQSEATVLMHGDKLPAHYAALANATMAQSLDYDDAIVPGVHIGSVAIPAALAAAEMSDRCSGRDLLTGLITGTEFACRLNTINSASFYGGFHGTGVCAIFAACVAASKILGLNLLQLTDALGLTLNMAGGSGQNNIEGVAAVSLVAGLASHGGLFCTRLARRGLSGPKEFLEGAKGWVSMFGTDRANKDSVIGELGTRYELINIVFKRFPSCGLTQTSIQGILEIMKENAIALEQITSINIKVGPFAKTVVGHFDIGRNPTVNAQFSIPYCVANAAVRGGCELRHFEPTQVCAPEVSKVVKLINVYADPVIEKRDQRAMEMEVHTTDSHVYRKRINIPVGSPGNEMSHEEHIAKFRQCASYGKRPLSPNNIDHIISMVGAIEDMSDVRELISAMIPE
jgi:2-methylcitrate dehydratase PrpD